MRIPGFIRPLATLALLLAVAAPAVHAQPAGATGPRTLTIDRNHSSIGFRIRHLVSNVDGRFGDFAGTITYDPAKPENSVVDVTVQAASIDTGTPRRDDDLRSENFFDVAKYPTLTFKSVSVQKKAAGELTLTGDLTMHGVTKRITVPVSVLGMLPFRGGEKAGFSTTFTVDRKDYNITWNRALDTGGALLGDEVTVTINLETGWEPPKPAATPAPSPAPTPSSLRVAEPAAHTASRSPRPLRGLAMTTAVIARSAAT
ncbi:MAG TPA: YceI family protein, partial [Thermoanaerobaculia bacterium]|nr:YceI family protein [Thermoanaerobaculia bacterium]